MKGTIGPEESEENTMADFVKSIKRNGGYIVHKPSSAGGIGTLFRGWDESGENYIFGHDNGMIFIDADFAQGVATTLGEGWKVTKVSELTASDFATMKALAAIFD